MNYCCEQRTFTGKWITSPIEYLNSLEDFPELEMMPGQWIWPQEHVRGFLRKDIEIEKEVLEAKLELWSDNLIDVYINCQPISLEKNATGVLEIGHYIREGVNSIAIRVYQTKSPLWISAAMHGCVLVKYTDGSTERFPTDSTWYSYGNNNFYQSREPENWMDAELSKAGHCQRRGLICTDIHPRLLRRSCYFRKKFRIEKSIAKADLYVTAKGVFEAYLNGQRTDDTVLSPGIKPF